MKKNFEDVYVLFNYKGRVLLKETDDWFKDQEIDRMNNRQVFPRTAIYLSKDKLKMIDGREIIEMGYETEMKEKYPEYFL